MRSAKVLKWLMIIGLIIILSLTKLGQMAMVRAIILFSKYRLLMPYILAQAKLETDNFTSKVYMADHNYFGMKFIDGRRGQVATQGLKSPEGDYYARYLTDSASVLDLLKWFEYVGFPVAVSSANEYAVELKKRSYFGGALENYIVILNKYL